MSGLSSGKYHWAQQGLVDPTVYLASSRVYLFSGTLDSTVRQRGMDEALE